MPLRTSRRRALQTAAAASTAALLGQPTAALQEVVTPPAGTPTALPPGTPTAGDDIMRSQVEAALAQLDDLIEDGMQRGAVPGVAVAVVYDDEVLYARGFGVRALGEPAPVEPDTVFQIGSISKSLSATTIASLIGDGPGDLMGHHGGDLHGGLRLE